MWKLVLLRNRHAFIRKSGISEDELKAGGELFLAYHHSAFYIMLSGALTSCLGLLLVEATRNPTLDKPNCCHVKELALKCQALLELIHSGDLYPI